MQLRRALALLGLGAAPAGLAEAETPLVARSVAVGLVAPLYATHAPGDPDRLFVVEQAGRIRIVDLSQDPPLLLPTPFLDLTARVQSGGERGLLGLAFHPDFAANGAFYVDYTGAAGDTVVSRLEVPAATPDEADPDSESILLSIDQPQANHNGGWIAFGPADGLLYVATGDGGGAGDTGTGHTTGTGNAQDTTANLLGKILRIDVDGSNGPGGAYGIPPDNPFVGTAGDDEIWSYGLRNPWRNAFDPLTGDLYLADVGQASWEEIDFQPGSSAGGENWGWRCREGAHDFDATNCAGKTFQEPVHEYAHGGSPFRCAITGGEVYRGSAIPDLAGSYFFADYCSAQIWSLRVVGGVATDLRQRTAELASGGAQIDSIVSFGRDARGEIYLLDAGGEVWRIEPVAAPAPVPSLSPAAAAALGLALVAAARRSLRSAGRAPPARG